MRRERLSGAKRRLVIRLSLGVLVLGLGLVWWASMNIGAQPRASVDAHQSPASSSATTPLGPVGSADTSVAAQDTSAMVLADEAVYAEYPNAGDAVGSLQIPALKQTFPIIEGTGDDELKRGVGHFSQSVLPGVKDNCVLSGHRDTVFTGLGKLKKGDQLVVKTAAGRFVYEISRIRIVDKDDKTVIVPADHAVLTLTTCYPFNFVGSAPDRYILVADMVTNE